MKKVSITLTVVLSLALFLLVCTVQLAQVVPSWSNEQNSLTILDVKCESTPSSVSNLSCKIRNDSSKEISAFTVLWITTTASGKSGRSYMMEDRSLLKSTKKISPGEVVDCESTGSETFTSGESVARVDVGIDYILFADGSTAGKDQTNSGSLMRNRQLTTNSLRTQLLRIYQEKGLEALLEELKH